MSRLSLETVRRRHNSIPEVVPFDKLPEFRRNQVIAFHESGKTYDGGAYKNSPFLTLESVSAANRIFAHGRKLHEDSSDLNQLAKDLYADLTTGNAMAKKQAWDKLYKAYKPYLEALAKHELYSFPSDVPDVVNQTFTTLHDQIEKGNWDEGSNMMTWVKYILRNKAMNWADKEHVRHQLDHVGIADEEQDEDNDGDVSYAVGAAQEPKEEQPDEKLADREQKVHKHKVYHDTLIKGIMGLMDQLPKEEREALKLYALHGKAYKDVGAELGWPLHKVKSRIENARYYLRQWVRQEPELGNALKLLLSDSKISPRNATAKRLAESIGQL